MFKDLKEGIMTITYETEKTNKKIEMIFKKNQIEILNLKNTITRMKIYLSGSTVDLRSEEIIRKLEERSIEIMQL